MAALYWGKTISIRGLKTCPSEQRILFSIDHQVQERNRRFTELIRESNTPLVGVQILRKAM